MKPFYRPQGVQYFYHDRYKVPSSWDELTSAQLVACCEVLAGKLRPIQRIKMLVAILMNVPPRKDAEVIIDTESAVKITAFLLEGPRRLKVPFPKWYPEPWQKPLLGPADKLATSTFGEFITADTHFAAYCRKGDMQSLHKLCACLYRERGPKKSPERDNGDPRMAFNSNTLEKHAATFQKMSMARKLAILTFFASCKAEMARRNPDLFRKNGGSAGGNWLDIVDAFAGGIDKYDALLNSKASLVLFSMNKAAAAAQK